MNEAFQHALTQDKRNEAEGKELLKKTTIRYFIQLLNTGDFPKFVLILAVMLSVIGSVTGLIVPLLTGGLIDSFSTDSLSLQMIFVLIVMFIAQAISSGISYYLLAYVGNQTVNQIRKRLWTRVLALPVPFFDKHRSAETMSRITNDTNEVKAMITDHLIAFFSNALTVIGSVALLFYLDWQMTLIILIAVPLGFGLMMPIGGKMYKISKGLYEQLAKLSAVLTQVISEIRLVKASNAENREQTGGFAKMDHLYRFAMKEAKVNAVLAPLMSMIMIMLLVVIIGYGGVRVSSGALSAGELVSFILLLFQTMFPFTQFATFYSQLQKVMGATERLKTILESEPERRSGAPVPGGHHDLVFENVSFSYRDEEKVLHNVNLTIPAKRITALVGPSGSGKTTIFSLIEQFYLPSEGKIRFGEHSIETFSLEDWRRKIGYVSQESTLMSGTIRENILYGRDDEVSEAELIEAAKLAYAHDFISALPRGYDTEVGERGIQLSGGQRQRVAIARALLRKPDILLLDEATASLDSDSEYEVQKALNNLMADRTTIIIAHRLSTIVSADQIIVLEYGKVTGCGKHDQLLRDHPVYAEWARKQFQAGHVHADESKPETGGD
jgi:ATP-binding cassette subfamily B protein AbcA/BmrA